MNLEVLVWASNSNPSPISLNNLSHPKNRRHGSRVPKTQASIKHQRLRNWRLSRRVEDVAGRSASKRGTRKAFASDSSSKAPSTAQRRRGGNTRRPRRPRLERTGPRSPRAAPVSVASVNDTRRPMPKPSFHSFSSNWPPHTSCSNADPHSFTKTTIPNDSNNVSTRWAGAKITLQMQSGKMNHCWNKKVVYKDVA